MDKLDRISAETFVQPGDVVLDIGAMHGTTAAAYVARGASAVYSFEPLARSRDRIPDELKANPAFHLLPYALCDRSGRQDLIVPRRNDGAGSLSRAYLEQAKRDDTDPGEVHSVEVRTLDELGLPRANFWKVDIEGAELGLLRGAERTLRDAAPDIVQMEIFLLDEAVYLETLNRLQQRFPHLWAIGFRSPGGFIRYDITTENISNPQFHLDLARAGTPHYYASSRPYEAWFPAGL